MALAIHREELRKEIRKIEDDIRGMITDNPHAASVIEAILAPEVVDSRRLIDSIGEKLSASEASIRRLLVFGGLIAIMVVLLAAALAWFTGALEEDASALGFLGSAAGIVLVGIGAGLLVIAMVPPRTDFGVLWGNVNTVATSGAFYFVAGLGLLLFAMFAQRHQEHPALTFLFAMLGVAIMLYGTGSQAAGAVATAGVRLPGTGESGGIAPDPALGVAPASTQAASDWSPVKANAAIAGGAAVLTALFGLGVIWKGSDMRDVFSDQNSYSIIRIYACDNPWGTCDPSEVPPETSSPDGFNLDHYVISAKSASDDPLFVARSGNSISVLVFRNNIFDSRTIQLSFRLRPPAPDNPNRNPGMTLPVPVEEADIHKITADCKSNLAKSICNLVPLESPGKEHSDSVPILAWSANFASGAAEKGTVTRGVSQEESIVSSVELN